jgi:DNA-directed RNA polymerase subunit K/omega
MVKRKTKKDEPLNFTKYEKARILGSRALQVSMGAPYLIKISKKQLEELRYNPLDIAKLEFDAGVIPITVIRPLPKIEGLEE